MRKLLKLIARSLAKRATTRRQEADDETQHNLLDLSQYGTPVEAPQCPTAPQSCSVHRHTVRDL